jgi:hypothetical protein
MNHPFVRRQQRIGHAAIEVFLNLNGFRLEAGIDEQEQLMLNLAQAARARKAPEHGLRQHIKPEDDLSYNPREISCDALCSSSVARSRKERSPQSPASVPMMRARKNRACFETS